MVYKKFRLRGISLSLVANPAGASFNISFSGKLWDKLVDAIRSRRAQAPQDSQTAKVNSVTDEVCVTVAAEKDSPYSSEEESLIKKIKAITWYHSHDFGNGIKTKGQYDHTLILDRYNFPDQLDGKRVLDVGTFDGFWAFEFERRGASEVLALDLDRPADLDWPPQRLAQATPKELTVRFGSGFELAKAQLNSSVQRVTGNIYDLTPESFGTFDIVHSGDFLLHLNSPVKALQNIARVCTEYALISDVYYPDLEHFESMKLMEYLGGYNDVSWWKFSFAALEQMILDAGFSRVELLARFKYGMRGMPESMHHAVFKAYK